MHLSSFAARLYSVIVCQTAPRSNSRQRTKTNNKDKDHMERKKNQDRKKQQAPSNTSTTHDYHVLGVFSSVSSLFGVRPQRPTASWDAGTNEGHRFATTRQLSETTFASFSLVCFGLEFHVQHLPAILSTCPIWFSFSPTPSRFNQVVGWCVILRLQCPRILPIQRGYSYQVPSQKETPILRISNKECLALITTHFCIIVVGHHLYASAMMLVPFFQLLLVRSYGYTYMQGGKARATALIVHNSINRPTKRHLVLQDTGLGPCSLCAYQSILFVETGRGRKEKETAENKLKIFPS